MWVWPHVLTLVVTVEGVSDWGDLRLPLEHVPYFFTNNPHLKQRCRNENTCPYKALLWESRCWGYEEKCPESQRKSVPQCDGEVEPTGRKSVPDRNTLFWRQADFGYVRERMDNMKVFCRGSHTTDSSLECTDALRFCRGTNVYMDLRQANMTTRDRYRNDIVYNHTFGGHCDLDKVGLYAAMTTPAINKRPLASWMQEMEHFASLPTQPLVTGDCDVIIDKPTVIIKMDEEYNIFHHTCVFMNLYISLHLNNSFSKDINLLVWDTSAFDLLGYMTELRGAFTKHDVILLKDLDGQRVCFRDAIFSLPSRMLLGIYYNLAPVKGCRVSGLVKAFSEHVLYNLNIQQAGPLPDKLRVTFLVRSTKIRRILNQEELFSSLKRLSGLDVQMVDFNRSVPFTDQLQIIHNTDLFIGLHGAGLTYMLYLPDWATVFEIYRCGINNMYPDLARMRGINYITWEKMDALTPENKTALPNYTNYSFDVGEFVRLVRVAVDHVASHPDLKKARFKTHREDGEL